MPVAARVPAKINLQLSVGLRRQSGFHPLTTVVLAVGVYETVTVATHSALRVTASGEQARPVPPDGTHPAVRAARGLARMHNIAPDVHLHLAKEVPAGSGLGGGGASAAATLLACDLLWDTATKPSMLARLGRSLGSDVPFALCGGAALATGRGDRVVPVPANRDIYWVLAVADRPLRPAEVFERWDVLQAAGEVPPPTGSEGGPDRADTGLLSALQAGDAPALAGRLSNDLQPAALSLYPRLRWTLDAGLAAGALAALVCGAGSTCAFLAEGVAEAEAVAARMRRDGLRTLLVSGPAYCATMVPAP
ncbi:4-diphosphocytidyl-2C-methyl-D-erythritol kinase [Kitasatospora sp. MMS16-BH015]|uniref:4-(cytidine 5'-diphospho)-2-C-methyl-D-erythritol kinase n=1 Tax=Kitasatospora sp. MMS16-BH015 TaxID=2018025 RepID=UPI000CA2A0E6|nr:4-(cytidine 5'-diphospho)-2-C-methyl-D-erythritol kinase [Kitasatospora sp. MMS16-BH015]AUG81579.1 4-diphosphocytidyl-2C-methyl-D-erythritol kinase [Kitasatospora sp. MMS16-BH015]